MSWRRLASICLGCIAVLLVPAPVQAPAAGTYHRADGNLSDWVGNPTWLSGETRISRGELIYDDWLYDDYGADLDNNANQPRFRGNLAPTRGDYRYPTNANRYGHNAADLRQLRVAADGNGLHVAAFLQTMKEVDAAAVTVGIDTDLDSSTGATQWPLGVGIDTPGVDRFVTFWGSGGFISDRAGQRQRLNRQRASLAENAIEVDVPWSSLGRVRGRSVRLYVVTGLANPQARRYLTVPLGQPTATAPGGGAPGSTSAFDVGFDSDEQFTRLISHWGEEEQSQALADRDVSALAHTVDLHELEEGSSDDYAPQSGRFYNRIFRSPQSYGEGISLKTPSGSNTGGSPDPQFLSPHQPYGLWIPADYQPGTPAPLLLMGHSLDVNHNEYIAVSPNLYQQLGNERSSLVITPLARGMDTWYIDSGFQDVMEAWADVKSHYSVDEERTHISGYSMGGYMTYRMGLLMPDRFASATPYVGPPAYQLWAPPQPPQPPSNYDVAGFTNLIVYNGMNLPFEINNSGADELVPAAGPQEQARTFREFGNPHLFYFYPAADHFALILADEWSHTRDWMDRYPSRNTTPDEVRYKRYPSMDLPQHGLRFDGAYWVDGMVVRSPGDTCNPGAACDGPDDFGLVEAYTLARGRARSVAQDVPQQAYPGPPLPGTVEGTDRVPGVELPARNFFDARFSNLAAVTFDTAGMGIDPAQPIEAHLTVGGAGPFVLTLRGDFGPVTATLDGHPVQVDQTAEGIEITLTLTSQHDLVVTPQ